MFNFKAKHCLVEATSVLRIRDIAKHDDQIHIRCLI
jgi:hypothetical protein